MKKITEKEASKLTVRRPRASTLRTSVERMEPGEILLVGKEECGDGNGPTRVCNRVSKATGKKFEVNFLADGTGYMLKRTG